MSSSSPNWPDRALVGYVMAYATPSPATPQMISDALSHHYRVFVYAFGYIEPDNSVRLPDGLPESDLKSQIDQIHDGGGIALLSFGGQNNTFTPGPIVETAAINTATVLRQYGFDGIDLDLEDVQVDVAYLEHYIHLLRDQDPHLFVTGAPQIAGGHDGRASLAPSSVFTQAFLERVEFDALFIQAYNQYGGAVFDNLQDTDVGFITASFAPLSRFIPEGTRIIIGEPACDAAGSGLSDPADITRDLQSGSVLKSPRYGGIMTWAINYDADQNWSFAHGVAHLCGATTTNR